MNDFIEHIIRLQSEGLFLAFGFALKYVGDKGWEWYKLKRLDKKAEKMEIVEGVVKSYQQIYRLLNEITTKTSASRAVIIAAHNGGDQPSIFSPLYTTVLYEANDELPTITERWHRQLIDKPYLAIIDKVLQKDDFLVVTEDLEPGILRNLYKAEGIDHSQVIYLTYSTKKESLLYLSLNFTHENSTTHKEKNVIRSCVTDIKNIMEDHRMIEITK